MPNADARFQGIVGSLVSVGHDSAAAITVCGPHGDDCTACLRTRRTFARPRADELTSNRWDIVGTLETPAASRTTHLHLLPFSADHYATLDGWFGSVRDVIQWGGPGLGYPLDHSQLDGMIQEGSGVKPVRRCWMAEDGASGQVGHAQLVFDWENEVARIARVVIAPAMRGQGMAVPMLKLVLSEAFAEGSMARTELNVFTWNEAAMRTYAKLGFKLEGVRRSSVKVERARWDTAIMGILRSEWEIASVAT